MRKLALLLALIVCGPALGQVLVVQSVAADHTSGATTTVGVAFTAANITTGNYIVASCVMFSTSGTISVTDNASGGAIPTRMPGQEQQPERAAATLM